MPGSGWTHCSMGISGGVHSGGYREVLCIHLPPPPRCLPAPARCCQFAPASSSHLHLRDYSPITGRVPGTTCRRQQPHATHATSRYHRGPCLPGLGTPFSPPACCPRPTGHAAWAGYTLALPSKHTTTLHAVHAEGGTARWHYRSCIPPLWRIGHRGIVLALLVLHPCCCSEHACDHTQTPVGYTSDPLLGPGRRREGETGILTRGQARLG